MSNEPKFVKNAQTTADFNDAALEAAYKEMAGMIEAAGGKAPATMTQAMQELEKADLGAVLRFTTPKNP